MSNQYRSILKATSIFGGTQFLQILIQLIRSKFVAILIGTTGMGLSTMYSTSLALIITIFGAGINTSVVRDLSKANDEHDWNKVSLIISVFRRLILALSILGVIFVVASSSFLSELAFKNSSRQLDYCFLSLMVFFSLLQQGNTALLVSLRRIKDTAKCSLFNSLATLATSVPFFYFWRLNGIVPGLIVSTMSGYVITYYFAHKIKLPKVKVSKSDIMLYGKGMLYLGMSLVIAQLLGNATTYGINIFISRMGGLSDLGLYNAGVNITMQSVMLVFSAMASDYFPRLVTSLKDNKLMNETVNQQTEIILYLAVPILSIMMVASPLIIRILLSKEFLAITGFIRILCLGMLLKAVSYSLGYISFAKGDKKVYMFLEGFYGNIVNLVLSIGLYYLWGLTGLAISFVIDYLQYYFVVSAVDRKRYGYQSDKTVSKLILVSVSSIAGMLVLSYILPNVDFYIIGSAFALILNFFYLKKLNSKTGLVSIINKKFLSRK